MRWRRYQYEDLRFEYSSSLLIPLFFWTRRTQIDAFLASRVLKTFGSLSSGSKTFNRDRNCAQYTHQELLQVKLLVSLKEPLRSPLESNGERRQRFAEANLFFTLCPFTSIPVIIVENVKSTCFASQTADRNGAATAPSRLP